MAQLKFMQPVLDSHNSHKFNNKSHTEICRFMVYNKPIKRIFSEQFPQSCIDNTPILDP